MSVAFVTPRARYASSVSDNNPLTEKIIRARMFREQMNSLKDQIDKLTAAKNDLESESAILLSKRDKRNIELTISYSSEKNVHEIVANDPYYKLINQRLENKNDEVNEIKVKIVNISKMYNDYLYRMGELINNLRNLYNSAHSELLHKSQELTIQIEQLSQELENPDNQAHRRLYLGYMNDSMQRHEAIQREMEIIETNIENLNRSPFRVDGDYYYPTE